MSPRDQRQGKRVSARAIRDLARESDTSRPSLGTISTFKGSGGSGGPVIDDKGWFPARINGSDDSGNVTLYGFDPLWADYEGEIVDHPGKLAGNASGDASGNFTGVSVSGDLGNGSLVLARPSPGSNGNYYELVPIAAEADCFPSEDCEEEPDICPIWYTGYHHLGDWFVSVGERLCPGQAIGRIARYDTGAHSHFALGDGSRFLNLSPVYLVGQSLDIHTWLPWPEEGTRVPGTTYAYYPPRFTADPGEATAAIAYIQSVFKPWLKGDAEAWKIFYGSLWHRDGDYYALDVMPPDMDPEADPADQSMAGTVVYNAVQDGADVISTVVYAQNVTPSAGGLVIVKHRRACCPDTGDEAPDGPEPRVHVKITGAVDEDGYYPCSAQVWNEAIGAWDIYDANALTFEPNGELLVRDARYICHYYDRRDSGPSKGARVYVTQAREIVKCGLEFVAAGVAEDIGKLSINVASLVGDGLAKKVESGYCDKLEVKTGCGLKIDDDQAVAVNRLDLVGYGLTTGEDPCSIEVNPGCGLKIDEIGKVAIDLDAVAGAGIGIELGNGCPKFRVLVGCALTIDGSDQVAFNPAAVAGNGLEAGCCSLRVKAGCAITVDSGGVSVDVAALAGAGLTISSGDCPQLQVASAAPMLSCHLVYDEDDAISVDSASLIDTDRGLSLGEEAPCPKIGVELEDDGGLEFSGTGGIQVVLGCLMQINGTTGGIEPIIDETGVNAERLNGTGLTGEAVGGMSPCKRLAVDLGLGLEFVGNEVTAKLGTLLEFDADAIRVKATIQTKTVVTAVNVDVDGHVTSVETDTITYLEPT